MTVQHRRFSLTLRSPLPTAAGDIKQRRGVLVGVGGDDTATQSTTTATQSTTTTAQPTTTTTTQPTAADEPGGVGLGEATPLPGWTESIETCIKALQSVEAAPQIERAVDQLDPKETPAARHGLAVASLDRRSRETGQQAAAWLAERHGLAKPTETVPVNATIGDADLDATVAEAKAAVNDGFDCLKLKVGVRTVDADVDRLRAVRDAVGSDVTLRADANGAWTSDAARRALRRLAPVELAYVEQPLPATDLEESIELARDADSATPIALDESIATYGIGPVLEAATAEHDTDARYTASPAIDTVVLKPMVLGGPDVTLAAALRARSAGVDPVVTTTVDAVVARTAAVHVAAAIPAVAPCGLATGSLLESDLAPDPTRPLTNGHLSVPDAPGLAGGEFSNLRASFGETRG